MLFIAKLTHPPELCWAREENNEKIQEMMASLENPGEFGLRSEDLSWLRMNTPSTS
jgi:hypothetical protein